MGSKLLGELFLAKSANGRINLLTVDEIASQDYEMRISFHLRRYAEDFTVRSMISLKTYELHFWPMTKCDISQFPRCEIIDNFHKLLTKTMPNDIIIFQLPFCYNIMEMCV